MTLLVIDTQKGIVDERLYEFEAFVKNIKTLISEARQNKVEVIYVQHDDGKGSGFSVGDEVFEIYEEFKPLPGEKIFVKTVNSCFKNTGLTEYLKQKSEDTVIVTGLQTDFCIDASVKGAFENGFTVFIPELCNSTVDNEFMTKEKCYSFYNEMMWPGRYGFLMSVEQLCFYMKYFKPMSDGEISLVPISYEKWHDMYKRFKNDPDIFIDMNLFKPYDYDYAKVKKLFAEQMREDRLVYFIQKGEEVMGEIKIKYIDWEKNCCCFGIHMIDDKYKNKGYGTRAEKLIVEYAFNVLGFDTVNADAVLKNKRSQHVMEKVGFKFVRTEGNFNYYSISKK